MKTKEKIDFTNIQSVFDHLTDRVKTLEELLDKHVTNPPQKDPQEPLTRSMLRDEYKVSYSTIHNAMRNGELEYFKINRKTLFRRYQINNWING